MLQIRNGVFETNSSSTHSICIPKKTKTTINQVHFGIGEYGWCNESVDPASYLYTAILYLGYDECKEKLLQLTEILNAHDIAYIFEKPQWEEWNGRKYLEYGYVDHGYEALPIIEALLNDENMLIRYLSEGKVYTGNDNQEPDYCGCDIALEYMYDWDTDKESHNPYHDEEKYDYFYKN